MSAPRIPLNFFGMPFGIAGLAGVWLTASEQGDVTHWVGEVMLAVAAAVWAVTIGFYLAHAATHRGRLAADLVDPVAGPFASLALITPMLLASEGVAPHAGGAGTALVDVFLALTVIHGAWFTGQLIYRDLDFDRLHPGYFLPTVAGGLVAAATAGQVHQERLGMAMLGYGLICWIILGSLILGRLIFRPALPAALLPTIAIEVAPAAVASLAYFSLRGGRIDTFAAVLAGYGVLMALAQLRLLPAFLRLRFAPSFWAFTFGWAAVANASLHWIEWGAPAGHTAYTYLVLAAITALVGGIAARTALALVRRQLLPPAAAPSTGPTAAPATRVPEPVAAA
ncbi:hypothetical protein GCM10023322_76290 [Rugosimonospora acidiphila]|uniref:Tellurite resistance protein n=1 Tax=Rugosimonospora acidiphila TaxID=556531 RepID=A0ABP9SPM2_9ACTN